MREIKFRVWDTDEKKMGEPETLGFLIRQRPHYDITSGKLYLQYTGLKDKNGKEIYEGDILKGTFKSAFGSTFEDLGVVEWNDKAAQFVQVNSKWPDGESNIQVNCEIIGNVYENAELLK